MAKHKAGRYQSICDLVEDLDSWKRDSKVRCYEESLLEKFMRITRNHIALVVSLLFTVILVSTTVGIAARINLQIINERNRITKNALNTAEEAHGKASNLNIQLLEAKVSAEENLRRLALTANDASKTLIEYGSSRYASGKLKLACIDFFRAWKLRSESGAHVDAYASLLQGHLTRQGASPIIVRHGSDISAIAVSPDDSCFATIADDNIVRLWDLSTGMPIGKPLAHEATLSCITFSRDSKKLATGTYSNKVQIWDVEKCEPITPPRKHSVFAGTIARMILAMIGELISEWEPDVGSYIRGEWYGDSDAYIKFLRFSSDDQTLISYSTDRNLRFWNVDSRASTLRSVMFRNEIDWVELDSILNRAIVSSFSGVFVYDCRTGRRLGRATDQPVKGVTSVASIAGKNLYAFSGPQLSNDSDDSREQSGLVNFWRCDSRRKTGNSLNVGREVDAMYATPDGKRLLVICDTEYLSTGTLPAQAQLWDLRTYKAIGKPISSWSMGSVIGSRNSYNSMVSEDGMTAAIVFENSAKLISTTSGEELYFPFVQDDAITAFAFTFDSTRVVIGSADGCARVWLIPRLDRSHAFLQPNQKYFPMLDDGLFSPDSRYFAFISGEPVNLKVWDIERQQILIDAPIAPQSSTDLVVDRQDARDKVAPRADQPWAEFMRSLQKINALQTTKKPIPGSPYMESPISANRGYKIGISNDSRMIAIRGPDANLHAWDLGTCQQIAVSLDASDRNRMRGDVAGVSYVWEFNSEQFRDVSDDEYTQNSSLPNSKLNRFVADSRRFWPIKSTLLIGDSMVNQTLWRFHGEFGWLSISPDCNWLLAVDKSSIVSVYHVPRLLPPLDDDAVRTHYMLESSEEYWAKPRGGWLEELSSFTMRQSEIAMLELANSAFESQNWFGTIFHYRRLCTRFPDDSTFHYRLGCAYSCNGQWSLAVVCFQRTVQLNPTDSDVMSNLLLAKLAEIRLVASNESEPTASHDAAIATEMQKLLIQLDDSATAVTIANVVDVAVLLDSAQIDKQLQLKWANRLVQLSPESSYYRELQGAALLRVSKYEEAFESLDESLQLSKKEAEWPPSDILTGRAIYGALTTHAFYALLKKASGVDSYVNQQVTIMKIEESERLHALDPYGKERFSIKWAQRARRTIVQDEVKRKCGGRDSAIKEMLNEILQKLPEVR